MRARNPRCQDRCRNLISPLLAAWAAGPPLKTAVFFQGNLLGQLRPLLGQQYRRAGSIAATLLDSLAAPPSSWKESDTLDPRDREDDDHATAVMICHPELDSLPGFVGKTIGGDLTGQAKTKDGRDITVIWITIDDTDPRNGAATLKKAQAMAPAFVRDVPVEVMGIPILQAS